ncbi:MAG: DNA mismatch repair endonuclease MutL, partial [Sphingomonadales bacterium]
MTIRLLPEETINRIAAGEVVERPASVVKELVENAIDAVAKRIEVRIEDGGKSLIAVTDDGFGMSRDELGLALERHATSKLPNDDLLEIKHMGFRGEALPSIASVSRVLITSRAKGSAEAWSLKISGGLREAPVPAALASGTRVEVRDIFFSTPARLKFLKSERTEKGRILDMVKRLAMAHPEIAFVLEAGGRTSFKASAQPGMLIDARLARLGSILGSDFLENALPVVGQREDVKLSGFAGLPTFNRGNAQHQYFYVNGRPVSDRMLSGALRGAYADFLARQRHPVVALFLEAPAEFVDVNVHPAKSEVRFQDPALVRGLIVGALRQALAEAGHRASTTVGEAMLGSIRSGGGYGGSPSRGRRLPPGLGEATFEHQAPFEAYDGSQGARISDPSGRVVGGGHEDAADRDYQKFPLGTARGQLHDTYIISQTEDGIVIVDQHAAHERLVYERMKAALEGGVAGQLLLVPEIVELDESLVGPLLDRATELSELGLVIEKFGPGAVVVRETPALLGNVDAQGLIRDLADD